MRQTSPQEETQPVGQTSRKEGKLFLRNVYIRHDKLRAVALFVSAMAKYMVLAGKRLHPSAAAGGRKTASANLLDDQMMVCMCLVMVCV